MKKKTENVVFRAALEPLEAAAIKAKAPALRGALHQAKSVWQRLEGTGAAVFRTDVCGAVTARLYEDGTVSVSTYLLPEDAA